MFTVRVDHGPVPQKSRSVYGCDRYSVEMAEDGRTATVSLFDGAGTESKVHVGEGGIAYVMNERGLTVDVIRTPPPLREGVPNVSGEAAQGQAV